MGEAIISRPLPSVVKHDLEFQDGYITFNNPSEYYALEKHRIINGVDYKLTLGISGTGRPTIEQYKDGALQGRFEVGGTGMVWGSGTTNPTNKVLTTSSAISSTELLEPWTSTSNTTVTKTFKSKPKAILFSSSGPTSAGYPISVFNIWVIGSNYLSIKTEQSGTGSGTSVNVRNTYLYPNSNNSITENADGSCTIQFCVDFNKYQHVCTMLAIY